MINWIIVIVIGLLLHSQIQSGIKALAAWWWPKSPPCKVGLLWLTVVPMVYLNVWIWEKYWFSFPTELLSGIYVFILVICSIGLVLFYE